MKHKVVATLQRSLEELSNEDTATNAKDGTLAADLHAFYNVVGQKEGWLEPQYATPLSQQSEVNQRKNVGAAVDVVQYWLAQTNCTFLVDAMKASVDYEANRGHPYLEAAAESQHDAWRGFVGEHQSERITQGNPKFNEKNFRQFNSSYAQLLEAEKDQDRLIIAVISDRVLERADIGYNRQIE